MDTDVDHALLQSFKYVFLTYSTELAAKIYLEKYKHLLKNNILCFASILRD